MHEKKIEVAGLENKNIVIDKDMKLDINFNQDAILFFDLTKVNKLNLKVNVDNNILARIIFWNEDDSDIDIEENYYLNNDSTLNLVYGDLAKNHLKRNVKCDLHRGSELLIDGASLTTVNKKQKFVANHLENNTTSNINNYAIVSEGGTYYLDVIGKIVKGAKSSKAFQDSRVLTVSDKQSATVLPQLLIDENDVEAAHAATVGQIDENQLYYMQSRGLSEMESMALLMSGYLMPIARAISDPEISKHVEKLINSKVSEICSIEKK